MILLGTLSICQWQLEDVRSRAPGDWEWEDVKYSKGDKRVTFPIFVRTRLSIHWLTYHPVCCDEWADFSVFPQAPVWNAQQVPPRRQLSGVHGSPVWEYLRWWRTQLGEVHRLRETMTSVIHRHSTVTNVYSHDVVPLSRSNTENVKTRWMWK